MGVTKKQQVEKSLASDVSVNSDVTLEKISAKEEPDDYVCQTCGKHYKKRKGNFSPSKSPIYAGTDGYMNTCKNCVDELFIHYTNFFNGTKENDGEIIYDGGWKEQGRIPMIYDYSGYCILSVKPSDSTAVLVELNQFNRKNLEVIEMNEEMMKALSDLKTDIISEFQDTRKVEVNSQVASLESQVSELNSKIDELNASIKEKDEEISELNQKCEKSESDAKAKEDELDAKNKELNALVETQAAELNELKKANKIAELNSALADYTDEQKDFAKEEIEAFNVDPFSVEINSITTKIDATAYKKIREENAKKSLEMNSMKDEFDGIMSAIDPIVKDDNSVDDFDCFA